MADARGHPRDRLCFAMMAGIGFLSSAIILTALYVLTTSLDRHHAQSGNERLTAVLNDWTNTLIASAEDHALADGAYDAVTSRDIDAFRPELMLRSDGGSVFDWIVILDADGQVVYEQNLPKRWDAATFFSGDNYRLVLDRIAQNPISKDASVGGVFQTAEAHFLAATTRITPDRQTNIDDVTVAYFIGGRNLDADALGDIAASFGGNDAGFTAKVTERSVPVQGPLGFVGNLTWEAELPGSQFRQIALPWVMVICLGLVCLTSWMAAYFRRMVGSLEKMHEVATKDHLTGVANRAGLSEILHTSGVQEALQDGFVAAISLDLDDFKKLNDEHGHHAGDVALRVSAERIANAMGRSDTVFRMGGDEFLCLILDPDPTGAAQEVVDRILNVFEIPMDLGGVCQVVTPSIGVAIANEGESWDDMLERSDAAMYRTKRRDFSLRVCIN